MLRAAVVVTATGLALAVPMSSQAFADLDPAALQRLQLDSATLKQVEAYDAYRTRVADQREKAKEAIAFARDQIGKPYRWGAQGPGSYDCSGLVMAAWRSAGVQLPRVTHAQYREVERKVKLSDLKPGDLVFFRSRGHVGMYVGENRYLHAPRSGQNVQIDTLNENRRNSFAGAVRPGAPAHREWPESVKELARQIDGMGTWNGADQRPPDKGRTPQNPHPTDVSPNDPQANETPRPGAPQPGNGPEGPDDSPLNSPEPDPAEQAAPPGAPAGEPHVPAARPEPRPMYATKVAAPGQGQHWNGLESHSWAKYVGHTRFGPFTAPNHTTV